MYNVVHIMKTIPSAVSVDKCALYTSVKEYLNAFLYDKDCFKAC